MQHIETKNIDIYICPVGMIRTNCYIVSNKLNKEAIIIDPGDNSGLINETIMQTGVKPVAVFLTHGHFDHILAVNEIVMMYGIKVYACENEEELLLDTELNCSKKFRRECMIKADYLFRDGEIINIAGIDIKAIHTPGHTVGSACLFIEQDKVLFSGDTLFRLSVGRTDFPTGSERVILNSIRTKLYELNDDVIVYPGHGEDTTIGYERVNSPYWKE